MAALDFRPQQSFQEFFTTDLNQIIANRSVFNLAYDNFVVLGGRGSGKSMTLIEAVVIEASLRRVKCLCLREIQLSISESVKAEIEDAIKRLEISHFFKITLDKITGLNGSIFIFKGVKNNVEAIKSISGVDIALFEESENMSQESWDKTTPSFRPKADNLPPGRFAPIVIVIFNPYDELDATFTHWVTSPPPRTLVKKLNYSDNIFFPDFLEAQRLHCLETRPRNIYLWIWEGHCLGKDGNLVIRAEWVREARFASNDPLFEVKNLTEHKLPEQVQSFDPAGDGNDYFAKCRRNKNTIVELEEWLFSDDIRKATEHAFNGVYANRVNRFTYDAGGGYGSGAKPYIKDELEKISGKHGAKFPCVIHASNSNGSVIDPKVKIEGETLTRAEKYANYKAQCWDYLAQLLYNTYRFKRLGHHVEPGQMLSIDIDDDKIFNKLVVELSAPLWLKSESNSKQMVEPKERIKKRTGLPSPNLGDCVVMSVAPQKIAKKTGFY